jgi:hypothetical protein
MAAPLFNKLTPDYEVAYNRFFLMTEPLHINGHRRELDKIVDLAEKVEYVLGHANPIWDTWDNQWGDREQAVAARQWHLNQLSHVKQRLTQAIICKRYYYDNTLLGKITKFFLKIFCLWNYGTSPAIAKAERFLIRYDSRYETCHLEGRFRKALFFWPFVGADWIRQNLDVRNFYNYDAPHAVEVVGGRNEDMPRFMVAVN